MNTAVVKKPCNHPLHLIITLFTCGMWAPFWIVAAMAGRKETVRTAYPPNAHWVVPPREWNPYKGEWQ